MATQIATLLNEGNIFLINQDYEAAEIRFNSAIEFLEKDDVVKDRGNGLQLFRALSHRGAARLSMSSKTADALTDIRSALHVLEETHSSDDITTCLIPGELAAAYARSGTVLYKLGEYVEAKDAFSYAVKIGNSGSSTDWSNWILQCEEKMAGKLGGSYAKKSGGRVAVASSVAASPPPAHVTAAPKKTSQAVCPKYQYYQNDSVLTIAILQANVQSEDLTVDISLDKLTVLLKKDNIEFTIICGTLFDAVDVSKCKTKITSEKVLIKLRKKNKHEWHELFGTGARDKVDKGKEDSASNYGEQGDAVDAKKKTVPIPTIDTKKSASRPYASQRDWNAIERNLKKDEENEKPQGDEALNNLFKEIYGKGDEETRRAMIKSYQTSGGTVLSTNWGEVADKDYEKERECPKGMEWKNWEGDKLPQKD